MRRHLTLTNVATAAVAVYFVFALWKLAKVASPDVPPLLRADGSSKAPLAPLWAAAPSLNLDLALSLRRAASDDALPLLSLGGLGYNWSALGASLQLEIEVLREPFLHASGGAGALPLPALPAFIAAPPRWRNAATGRVESGAGGAPRGLRVLCRDVEGGSAGVEAAAAAARGANATAPSGAAGGSALAWLVSSVGGGAARRKPVSLCRRIATAMDAARGCRRQTRSGFATDSDGEREAASSFGSRSFLVNAARSLASAVAAAAAASGPSAAEVGGGGGGGSDAAAATLTGGPVLLADYALDGASSSSTLVCAGGGDAGAARRGKHAAAARRIGEALLAGSVVYAHSSVSWGPALPGAATAGAAAAPASSAAEAALRTASSSTPLVLPLEYAPPPLRRRLLEDPSGAATAARAAELVAYASLPAASAMRTLSSLRSASRKAVKSAAASDDAAAAAAAVPTVCAYCGPASSSPPPPPHLAPVADAPWPHFVSSLDIKLIMDTAVFPRDELPPALAPYLSRRDAGGARYAPSLAANPVRPTRERFLPLNGTLARPLPLLITLAPVSVGTWQLLQLLDASLDTQQAALGASDRDTDEVVRMLAETPLPLLAATLVVSVVHLLFDVLALKSDVDFWSAATSLAGISVRALGAALISQLVITAYLAVEGASLLVLLPQAAFAALQAWKLARACGISLVCGACCGRRAAARAGGGGGGGGGLRGWLLGWLPALESSAALAATAGAGGTNEHDALAVHFLSLCFAPLLLGFAAYALLQQTFTSWSDYALTTAVTVVYTLGFVFMTPQLYINFKLKSVAHMPWGVLGFRFFNTIIDDLFAALVKMPLIARVSVFRDDVVFVLYMLQRWRYRVDASRPAEQYDADESAAALSDAAAAALRAADAAAAARATSQTQLPALAVESASGDGSAPTGARRRARKKQPA